MLRQLGDVLRRLGNVLTIFGSIAGLLASYLWWRAARVDGQVAFADVSRDAALVTGISAMFIAVAETVRLVRRHRSDQAEIARTDVHLQSSETVQGASHPEGDVETFAQTLPSVDTNASDPKVQPIRPGLRLQVKHLSNGEAEERPARSSRRRQADKGPKEKVPPTQ